MQRQTKLGLSIASALSLALPCAGCLVTNELEFPANLNAPSVKLISPRGVSAVPSVGSDECTQNNRPDSLYFHVALYDRDVDQTLWVAPYVNGVGLIGAEGLYAAMPGQLGTEEHESPVVCIPLEQLREPCNRVRLIVTDNLADQRLPVDLSDPNIAYVEWYLTGPAQDNLGSSGKPYTSFTDCLPPDGGL